MHPSDTKDLKIAIIGLGYVGLPLAVEFGKSRSVVGFEEKIVFDESNPDGSSRKLMGIQRLGGAGWNREIALDEGLAMAYEAFHSA